MYSQVYRGFSFHDPAALTTLCLYLMTALAVRETLHDDLHLAFRRVSIGLSICLVIGVSAGLDLS